MWKAWACIGLAAAPVVAAAATATTQHSGNLSARLLAAHNAVRAEVGAPPLQWDPELARSALSYGPQLARLGRLVHSPRETRPGQRENLAMGFHGHTTPEQLFGLWEEEKRLFVPGRFPHVSRTGNWVDVAHYTQMIWKSTTRVGCAVYSDGRWDYLICRYSPPGNRDGSPVI